MAELEDVVKSVVSDFISNETLFTALDVSNKVKETLASARHRNIRDIVRQMWATDIELSGYGRSPITVVIGNGNTAQALLYHPLADSWDLDSKYDVQKREQIATQPVSDSASTTVSVDNSSINVSDDGHIVISKDSTTSAPVSTVIKAPDSATLTPALSLTPTLTQASATQASVPAATVNSTIRDQWMQIFATHKSMFPRQ